jgi:hypothetical protein
MSDNYTKPTKKFNTTFIMCICSLAFCHKDYGKLNIVDTEYYVNKESATAVNL